MHRAFFSALSALVVLAVVGCASGAAPTARHAEASRVSGSVTCHGRPLIEASWRRLNSQRHSNHELSGPLTRELFVGQAFFYYSVAFSSQDPDSSVTFQADGTARFTNVHGTASWRITPENTLVLTHGSTHEFRYDPACDLLLYDGVHGPESISLK